MRLTDFLEVARVDQVAESTTLHARYVAEPADSAGAGGLGVVMFDEIAFLLGSGTLRSDGPSRHTRSWIGRGGETASLLSSAMNGWFDNFAMSDTRSLELFNFPRTPFDEGRTKSEEQFRLLASRITV